MNKIKQLYLKWFRFRKSESFALHWYKIKSVVIEDGFYDGMDKNGDWLCSIPINKEART